jgi:hypothetical protein
MIIGKSSDEELNAYNMLLVADNYLNSGDSATAESVLKDLIEQFPNAGSAKLAEIELSDMEGRVTAQGPAVANTVWSLSWLLTVNILVFTVLIAIFVIWKIMRRTRV